MIANLGDQILGHSGQEVKLSAWLMDQVRKERGLGKSWRPKRVSDHAGLIHSLIP